MRKPTYPISITKKRWRKIHAWILDAYDAMADPHEIGELLDDIERTLNHNQPAAIANTDPYADKFVEGTHICEFTIPLELAIQVENLAARDKVSAQFYVQNAIRYFVQRARGGAP